MLYTTVQIESPWQFGTKDLCTPVTVYLISDTAIDILGCRGDISLNIRCTVTAITAHMIQLFSKQKQLKCVITMEIIAQEYEPHVFQNFVY
jgi:hypothetical protein